VCGIAGFSVHPDWDLDRTLAARALLAAIAERGADAAGYAYRAPGRPLTVRKQQAGASALLEHVVIPAGAGEALLHVRDYTKGHPSIAANNHPVRHGAVTGVHNGIIVNDDDVLAAHGIERAEPEMTVDSEAIFALAEAFDGDPAALEQLRGSLAAAWVDERRPGRLYVARGIGRPLWLGKHRGATFFASTRTALEVVERYTRLRLRTHQLAEGRLLTLVDGDISLEQRFAVDRTFVEEPLPAVRAAGEGAFCLSRLAALAAAA
jgi:glucosamine 6-phosphate synthetase-like amidotransferase/phosphosugar isomerase protein